jgi:hypothetical protein
MPVSLQVTSEASPDAYFINDPAKKRTPKTVARYHEMMGILFDILGIDTPIDKIDREACRRLLNTLRYLPTNSPKRFPLLTAVDAAEMAKAKGLQDVLGPVSINGYSSVGHETEFQWDTASTTNSVSF